MEAVKSSCCCSGSEIQTNGCCSGSDIQTNGINTLQYNPALCINCGMCLIVCPHAVFSAGNKVVRLDHPENCMECGACALNCPPLAIHVDSGVGCAAAMINAALKGGEACCGPGTTCCS